MVNANILAARSNYIGVINVGSGKNISVNKIMGLLNNRLDKKIEPIHGPAVIEPKSTLADRNKAKEILGWEPRVTFEQGLERMLNET